MKFHLPTCHADVCNCPPDDEDDLRYEIRQLKDQLACLSKTQAENMHRLSDMIDKREEALGHIAAIMREKDESGEDLLIGSTAWKSVIRWSVYFQNA